MRSRNASSFRPKLVRAVAWSAPLAALLACTVNAPITAPINIPASADEIRSCRQACTTQASGSCIDGAGLATCNTACDASSSTGASAFVQCVQAAACNEKCDADLRASALADAGAGEASTQPPDAGPAGQDGASDAANEATLADAAPEASSPELAECKAACNSPIAKSCYEVSTMLQQCEDGCANVSVSARTTFVSCVAAAGVCSAFYTCYGPIGG